MGRTWVLGRLGGGALRCLQDHRYLARRVKSRIDLARLSTFNLFCCVSTTANLTQAFGWAACILQTLWDQDIYIQCFAGKDIKATSCNLYYWRKKKKVLVVTTIINFININGSSDYRHYSCRSLWILGEAKRAIFPEMLHWFLEECRIGITFHFSLLAFHVSKKQRFTLQTDAYSWQENDIREFQSADFRQEQKQKSKLNFWIFTHDTD